MYFDGAGVPRDHGPALTENMIPIGGPSFNPAKRILPKNMIEKLSGNETHQIEVVLPREILHYKTVAKNGMEKNMAEENF